MKKKLILTDIEKEELKNQDVIYCTECGESLDLFGLEEGSYEVDDVKLNFEHCKKIGKFKGEICSKLFIINENPD